MDFCPIDGQSLAPGSAHATSRISIRSSTDKNLAVIIFITGVT
jgi:hypothetical protein